MFFVFLKQCHYSFSISQFLELNMELSHPVSVPLSIGAVLEEVVALDLEVRDEPDPTPPSSLDFFRLVFLGMSGRSLAGESEPPSPEPGRLCRLDLEPSDGSLVCRLLDLDSFFGEEVLPLPVSDEEWRLDVFDTSGWSSGNEEFAFLYFWFASAVQFQLYTNENKGILSCKVLFSKIIQRFLVDRDVSIVM